MKAKNAFDRFIVAQENTYQTALEEIRSGKKRSHWMWYIFPQLLGLGHSETAKYYSLHSLAEAKAYIEHPLLGARLIQISDALCALKEKDALVIFGTPDNLKLHSCATLFCCIDNANPVFFNILKKFFNGAKDSQTIMLLQQ